MSEYNKNMLYARQFVLLPYETDVFLDFNFLKFGGSFVYTHPLLGIEKIEKKEIKILLIGYIIDPHNPNKTDKDILSYLATTVNKLEDIPLAIYSLSGRFILFFEINGIMYVFHDACGLRAVTYTLYDGHVFLGSDENILSNIISLPKGKKYDDYQTSELKEEFETLIPAGVSLYEGVNKLIPNHYLDVYSLKQVRYYPLHDIVETDDIEGVTDKCLAIFRGEFKALINRGLKLAVTATAGRDSRLLMALAEDQNISDIHYYTMSYYQILGNHFDIVVPKKILKTKGLVHHVYDCTDEASNEFKSLYYKNTLMAHKEWCNIAYGMDKNFPKNRFNIKGVASEIVGCYYYSNKKGYLDYRAEDVELLLKYTRQQPLLELDFTKKAINEWFEEIKYIESKFSYNILDFFFWEQRMGSWQAQSQLEWDIVQESYTPFNNRELIHTMFNLSKSYRIKKNSILYRKIIDKTWPILNSFTYDNEKKGLMKIIPYIKKKLKKRII